MGQTPGELRQEIDQKREDAAAKIDRIEAKVQDTAQMAKDTVMDTAQTAKETVADTVDQTVAKVKEGFDIRRQAEERPLVALGAALFGGFLLGGLLGGDDDRRGQHGGQSAGMQQGGMASGLRSAAKRSGLDDTIENVAAAVMGSLTERIRAVVGESFPQVAERLKQGQGASGSGPGRGSSFGSGAGAPSYGTTGASTAAAAPTDAAGRTAPYVEGGASSPGVSG